MEENVISSKNPLGVAGYKSPEGFHRHKCRTCGHVWEHSDECAKDWDAHECPICTNVERHRYRGPEAPMAVVLTASHSKLLLNILQERIIRRIFYGLMWLTAFGLSIWVAIINRNYHSFLMIILTVVAFFGIVITLVSIEIKIKQRKKIKTIPIVPEN